MRKLSYSSIARLSTLRSFHSDIKACDVIFGPFCGILDDDWQEIVISVQSPRSRTKFLATKAFTHSIYIVYNTPYSSKCEILLKSANYFHLAYLPPHITLHFLLLFPFFSSVPYIRGNGLTFLPGKINHSHYISPKRRQGCEFFRYPSTPIG